jgi:hypothetical protein
MHARLNAYFIKASDLASTSRIIIAIVTIAKRAKDWNLMNEQVLLLSKKHGQLKQATTKMVQTVMGFLDDTPNLETKLSVIETLRTVTEGKVRRTEACVQALYLQILRSSSKSSALELHGYYQTSRRSRATSPQPQTSSASSRSRRLVL